MDSQVMTPQIVALVEQLRARDGDAGFVDAPVLDVYGRISKNPETGETEKVDRQLEDTLREVTRRRARLGEVLRDDGRSAWSLTAKRPGWARLLERLEARRSAGVIAWHTDRLMRQPRDLERLIAFGDQGLVVGSCHGDYNLASADDRFTLRVIVASHAKASDDTSRRQKRKAAAMREKGMKSGGPRWFGLPGNLPTSLTDGKPGVPVPEKQVTIEREAVAWGARAHLDGLSLTAVAQEWNRRKVFTVNGLPWDSRTVPQVLKHPRIAGLLAYHGVVVGRLHGVEPMVSQEEYQELAAKFLSRKRGRPSSGPYLLSGGLLVCGREGCGQPLTGKAQSTRYGKRSEEGKALPVRPDGTPRRHYICRKRAVADDGHCGRLAIEVTRADREIRDLVIRVLSDPKHARQIARQSAKLAQAQAKLDAARADGTELARRLGEGRLSLDQFDAAMGPLTARITRLAAEADALRDAGAGQAARAATAAEIAAEWDAATVAQQRAMVRRVAPRGIMVLPATAAQHSTHAPAAERLRVL